MSPIAPIEYPDKVDIGKQITLLPATVITANGTVNRTPVTGLEHYIMATILLIISAKNIDAGTTLDIFIQYSPDGGVTWDDLYHFAQLTSAAMGNGSYVVWQGIPSSTGVKDQAVADGTLAVQTLRQIHWCDRLRVKTVAAGFAGADTVTVALSAFMV